MRALGVSDLTWLYLVAVVNLNVVPVIAVGGPKVLWLLAATILLFFVPQGIGVIELAEHMPGEGGLYLWTKESYGDFHGFLCGWCYWMTNMFFVPSLLFFVAGVTTYIVGGSAAAKINDSRVFFFLLPVSLLWITVFANVRGLGVGKWVNNIGGIGALVIGAALMIMGAIAFLSSIGSSGSRVSNVAHLGGMLFGLLYLKVPLRAGFLSMPDVGGRYRQWKMQRAKKKFQVYMRKHDGRGPWVN